MISRRLVIAALAAVVVMGLVTSTATAGCPSEDSKPKITTLAGTVKSVNAEARTLVLTTGEGESGKDVSLKVCPKASIVVDGNKATLADVKAGVKAKVCHNKDLVAVRVAVGGSGCPGS